MLAASSSIPVSNPVLRTLAGHDTSLLRGIISIVVMVGLRWFESKVQLLLHLWPSPRPGCAIRQRLLGRPAKSKDVCASAQHALAFSGGSHWRSAEGLAPKRTMLNGWTTPR